MNIYDYEKAQAMLNQQPRRRKVKKRSNVVTPLLGYFVAVAVAVSGIAFIIVDTNKKRPAPLSKQEMSEFVQDYFGGSSPYSAEAKGLITDEVIKEASLKYDMEHDVFSANRIAGLRGDIDQEYLNVMTLMKSNAKLNDKTYNLNNIDEIKQSYASFKKIDGADNTNYQKADEKLRLNKSNELYATKIYLLQAKAKEIAFEMNHLNPKSDEYAKKVAEFNKNGQEISKILDAFKTLNKFGVTVYVDNEENIQGTSR